jgi:hypothetical protein
MKTAMIREAPDAERKLLNEYFRRLRNDHTSVSSPYYPTFLSDIHLQ